MKEQFDEAIYFLKQLEINGCLTGSSLLGYIENGNQDIDVFCYDELSFTKAVYTLNFDPMFLLLEPLEAWKFKDWTTNSSRSSLKKLGLVSIKFKYNLLIDVNIIYKEGKKSIFDVLSSFDMDIIAKGYDLKTKQLLDLSEKNGKIASWNKWNKQFYDANLWNINQLLRQFQRVVKYHKRGYNTDQVTLKYIEIIDGLTNYNNIFNSSKLDEKIDNFKVSGVILKQLLNTWLNTHTLTDQEEELLITTIKELR